MVYLAFLLQALSSRTILQNYKACHCNRSTMKDRPVPCEFRPARWSDRRLTDAGVSTEQECCSFAVGAAPARSDLPSLRQYSN